MTEGLAPPAPEGKGTLHSVVVAAIAVMSILIVILLAAVGYGVFMRKDHKDATPAAEAAFTLPADGEIQQMQVSDDRLILRVRTGHGTEIDIIDTHDGHLVRRIAGASAPR